MSLRCASIVISYVCLHCILFAFVLTHLATFSLIMGVQKRPTYPWKAGGSIAIVTHTKIIFHISRSKNEICARLCKTLISRLSFGISYRGGSYIIGTVLSTTQPRIQNLTRYRVKREKTRFVHHNVSIGRRRTVKVLI